ncbi:MAG: carboxylating nicotinate-nucleotide diphosphorylase [candidate division Zixibacteria bacterium]|nr:carboxylating nicotinate-nucleotide diphosphorylase [candidate division Zixibacteria bacterium]
MINNRLKTSFGNVNIDRIIQTTLSEDRYGNDITTKSIGKSPGKGKAKIIAKQNGIICGIDIAIRVFKLTDSSLRAKNYLSDADTIKRGQTILEITGRKSSILKSERTALNFLTHLSGIATYTHDFVKELRGTKAVLLDTRKTLPCLRDLQKYAVTKGGGKNHRRDLSDMYLLKENHIQSAGGIDKALETAINHRKKVTSRRGSGSPLIEVEVQNIEELKSALQFEIDRIMLDNFSPAMVKKAVKITRELSKNKKRIELEVSGGITISNIRKYALTGVDYISVGALTHSAPSFDLSLIIE